MTDIQIINEVSDYIIKDPEFIKEIKQVFKNESQVVYEVNGNIRKQKFIGTGCGITYIVAEDHRDILAIQLKKNQYAIENKCHMWLEKEFSNEEKNYFESNGCPLGAILCQDQGIQIAIYKRIIKWAEAHGSRYISFVSRLD